MTKKLDYRSLSATEKRLYDNYKNHHWGINPTRIVTYDDPDLPESLVEMGRLAELHIAPESGPEYVLEVDPEDMEDCHLLYDTNHEHQRLYVILPPKVMRKMRGKAIQAKTNPAVSLKDLARKAKGHHSRGAYPDIKVRPLGRLINGVYATNKKGDGSSLYVHRFGEEGGIEPIIGVDNKGRIWFAGGSYHVTPSGIIN
jgi:hypothetical protein